MITNKDWKTIWSKLLALIKSITGDVDVKEKGTIQAQLNDKAGLDGSGAKGDWGINITGNAETATKATSADKLNTNAGSATQPTYFADGIPKECTYTLEKSVPADAVFTDTKYKVRTRMTELGFTCGETYTVQQFFDTLYDKGISENILLYFIYDNSSAAKVSDGTTTIDMNGVSCYISVSNKYQTYTKHSAIVTNERKAYLLYKKHDGSVTPSSQGIIDLTSTVATSCTGNSATATKATQDGNGNVIADTYLPLSGGTINGSLNVSGTINSLTTKYVYKTENGGYPTYLLMFDVTSLYLGTSSSKWGFNGLIYSSRGNGYINQEEVATIAMACAYQKSTTIDSTLRLTTNNGNYRPCIIHDTVNGKYYLSLKLSGQGRDLVFQGYKTNTMSTTQIKATDGSGTLPTGYEFTFDPANCTMGMGISSSCSGNSKTASGLGIYGTEPIKSISDDTYENWIKLPGCSVSWYNTNGYINGQPSRYGFLLNLTGGNKDVHQLWFTQIGSIYRRSGNYNGLKDWYEMLDSNNYSNYAIPLTGTTALAGDITPETNNKYDLGDATHRFYYGYFENIYAKQSLHSLYHYIEDSSGVNQGRLEYSGLTDVMYSSYVSTSTNDLTKSDIVGIDLYGYTNLRVRAQNRLYFNAGTTISASMSITTGSDEKIKKFTDDIEQDKEALIKLFDIIQIKSYRYRYSKGNALTLGFSAQDVEEACNEIGIDPEKYGILNISYNHHMCQGEEEDMKYYPKFYEISYNDMYNLALFKIQSMEKEHKEILEEHNNRLKALEEKLV